LSTLSKICDQIQDVEEELQEVGFLEELEASVDYLLGVFSELKEVQNNFTILLAKVAAVNAVEKLIKETDEKLATYEEEFHEALGEGGVCPLCGSVIE
jgi:DNA repair exonuclease SbcCD ATPase subunit